MAQQEPRLAIQRIYDHREGAGDYRVLVDRLWPRGIAKAKANLDEWAKDVAPSAELRRWYGHEPTRFEEFARRYRRELAKAPAAESVARLHDLATRKPVALITATRDLEHSGALVLMHVLHDRS